MQELEIDESWQRIQDPFAHLAPLLLGPIVSTLTSLRLGAVYWDRSANHPAYLAHSRLYSSVSCLELSVCKFRTLNDLRRLLSELPMLVEVSLIECSWNGPFDNRRIDGARGPRLISLSCDRDGTMHFVSLLKWLLHTPSNQSIRSLTFPYTGLSYGRKKRGPLQDLLWSLRLSLESLTLPFNIGLVDPKYISALTNLRSFHINHSIHRLDTLTEFLKCLMSLHLRALHLTLIDMKAGQDPYSTEDDDTFSGDEDALSGDETALSRYQHGFSEDESASSADEDRIAVAHEKEDKQTDQSILTDSLWKGLDATIAAGNLRDMEFVRIIIVTNNARKHLTTKNVSRRLPLLYEIGLLEVRCVGWTEFKHGYNDYDLLRQREKGQQSKVKRLDPQASTNTILSHD